MCGIRRIIKSDAAGLEAVRALDKHREKPSGLAEIIAAAMMKWAAPAPP